MSDAAFTPSWRSALHDLDLVNGASPVNATKGVWAAEFAPRGYITLRGDPADSAFTSAMGRALPTTIPVEPCSFVTTKQCDIFWISPDEWIIAGPRQWTRQKHNDLEEALRGIHGLASENSGGFTEIAVLGRDARNALSHCTALNLDALGPGRIAGTNFGKLSAYLRREGQGFRILARRSFATYIWEYLERASRPYGFAIAEVAAREAANP